MHTIKFTRRGERELQRLPVNIRRRIANKLIYYASSENPLLFARHLVNLPPSTHRYRIGKYRVSFFIKGETIFVERVELRGQAYRHR